MGVSQGIHKENAKMSKFVFFVWTKIGLSFFARLSLVSFKVEKFFQFSGHEPIYFIENKEKTLRASYDRGTQIVDYMD